MKWHMGLFARITEWQNLEHALALAMRGKKHRPDAMAFAAALPGSLEDIARRISTGQGPHGEFREFDIRDPKARRISAPCFADRVLHHALINVCEPVFEKWLIRQIFACRRGMGVRAAIEEASHWTTRHAWYLQLDVRHYFETIPRDRLFARLQRLFGEPELLRLWWQIIDSHRPGEPRGMPIGCLTSQHLANFYLGFIDRLVKEHLRIPGYARYMDDMLLWHDDKDTLIQARDAIMAFASDDLGLELKTPKLHATRPGLAFLGFRFHPGWIGLARRSRKRLRMRVRRCRSEVAGGHVTEGEAQARLTACTAAIAPAKCRRLRQRVFGH